MEIEIAAVDFAGRIDFVVAETFDCVAAAIVVVAAEPVAVTRLRPVVLTHQTLPTIAGGGLENQMKCFVEDWDLVEQEG